MAYLGNIRGHSSACRQDIAGKKEFTCFGVHDVFSREEAILDSAYRAWTYTMNVLLLTRYGRFGASSRVRSLQYIPYLQTNSVRVTVSALIEDSSLLRFYWQGQRSYLKALRSYVRRTLTLLTCRRYDLLWIEKELFPWLPPTVERLLARLRIPYIIDYDDPVVHIYDLHQSFHVRKYLGSKIDVVMKNAALVTVGNDYLASRAENAGAKRVEILPSVVDLEKYSASYRKTGDVFTIGWVGTPITMRHLSPVKGVLTTFCKRGQSRLVIIGASVMESEDNCTIKRPWTEDSEVSDIQGFDIGIMPLPDSPWERGKCGYKLIQYMACSKPVVASPVGVNSKIVEHGINGFLARSDEEWSEALITLLEHPELRQRMGDAARVKVEREYSLQATFPRLLKILRSAAGRRE